MQPAKTPLPREHGAWGLLLQPFAAGALLAPGWSWLLLPALGLAVCGFLLREPLTVLARQRFVWQGLNPQTPLAVRWLVMQLAGVALCLGALVPFVPLVPLAALATAALALTVAAVWFTVHNRQRSVALQLVSAPGLGSTGLLAVLAVTHALPGWAWLMWALLATHGAAAILVVRARLWLRQRAPGTPRVVAAVLPAVQAIAAAACLATAPRLALPLGFSAAASGLELWRLGSPAHLAQSLTRTGFTALAVAIAHTLLTIAALWDAARGGSLFGLAGA